MSNLTEISIAIRKIAIWLAIAFAGYLVLRFFLGIIISVLTTEKAAPPPPPDVRFNKLPKPKFPENFRTSAGLEFSLQTISGLPPEASSAGKVYYMPKKLPSFLAPENTRKLAQKLGFLGEPEINSLDYYFTDANDPLYTLRVDSVNLHFHLKYEYGEKPEIFTDGLINTDEEAENEVKNFLQAYATIDGSLLEGSKTLDYLKFDRNEKKFVGTTSLSTTQAVRINFFRKDLDSLKVRPPNFHQSYNYVIYAPTNSVNIKNILEINYIFWPIATDDFATYPLIPSEEAYQYLISGQATVASMGFNTGNSIIIRDIYLAYYDSEEPQLYLQPVFVFEGDNNFIAYYPAVSADYLE